jgi:hypothetical protein
MLFYNRLCIDAARKAAIDNEGKIQLTVFRDNGTVSQFAPSIIYEGAREYNTSYTPLMTLIFSSPSF